MRIILEYTKFRPTEIKTYLSASIRYFDKTYYNHIGIIITIYEIDYVFEAWKRVILTPLDKWIAQTEKHGNEYKILDIEGNENYAREKALSMCGCTEYNYIGTMFYQLIYQETGKWIGSTGEEANKKVQCAQFVAICLKRDRPELYSPRLFNN